jgi:L-ascorbate metabolism protein UlaG (beta-lactamase superfamily)
MPVTTFRIPMTMGEAAAVKAVRALNPKTVIPIHLGITPRSPLLRTKHSPEGFTRRLRAAGLNVEVKVLHDGESWENDLSACHIGTADILHDPEPAVTH